MKKLIAFLAAGGAFAAVCVCFYFTRPADIFGHEFTIDKKSVVFDGPEITDLESLETNLKKFNDLRSVDLGSFMIHADDAEDFNKEFPGVELKYDTYIEMYGDRIDTATETLDLSGKVIDNVTDLRKGLPYLKNIKSVMLGSNTVPQDIKVELLAEYPDVDFDLIATYEVYGKKVRDDITELDLRDADVGSELYDTLKLFEELKGVDLHGKEFTPEEQMNLVKTFPNIKFGWDVDIGGTKYDSLTEDLDLSNSWWISTDLMRERIPLFPNLKRLDMSDCGASNEEMASLRADYPDIKVVWMLHMGRWYLKTDAVAFSVLIYDYSHKRLTSDDIQVLQYCTDLRALDIGHQAITDLSVIGDYLTELRVLILADNAISDLTPLSKLKHLHYLEFFVNWRISDLSPLAECRELVDLNISHNGLISDISPLMDLPLLERLWLEHTAVPAEDVQRLRERYPNATIVDQGYGSVDQGWRWHDRYFAMIDMYHNNYISDLFTMYDQ